MNCELFKKHVFELIEYFEKSPKQLKGLSVKEYQQILKAIIFLIRNCPESIDLKAISKVLKLNAKVNYSSVINQIDRRKGSIKLPESLYYSEIESVLKFLMLATDELDNHLSNDNWIELTSSLRPFEMERVYANYKMAE